MQAQRGHKGCTSASTDACIDGTVRVRVRHVIDREGGGGHSPHGIERRENVYSTVGEGGIDRREERKLVVQGIRS